MDIKCFIIILPTAFLKEAFVKKLKKEGMHFAPFVTEVVMEKLTFYAGLEDGKLLGHAPETTSLAFRHKTGSPTELQTIYFDYVIFRVLLRSWSRKKENAGGQKTKKGKVCENRTKEDRRTGVRTSGKTNSPLVSPVYKGQAQGEEKKHKKRSFGLLFVSFGSACPHALRMYFPLLAIKTEL